MISQLHDEAAYSIVNLSRRLWRARLPNRAGPKPDACFELYRRHMRSPEIVSFDELYQRARCIVENISREAKAPAETPQTMMTCRSKR